jgi:hypothetical protein
VRIILYLATALAAAPLAAQERTENPVPVEAHQAPTAEQIVEAANEKLRAPGVRKACPPGVNGEIVVCAPAQVGTGVPSSLDDAIARGEAVPDGRPRAPDEFGIPPCHSYTVCSKVGRAPPPLYLIDLKAIPEAPAGSDAARYKEDAAVDQR